MNKHGFTLMELLVVIGVLAILLILLVPASTKILNSSIRKLAKIQEKEIESAALLYLEDYCKSPLTGNTCPTSFTSTISNGVVLYSGIIKLDVLESSEYIELVELRGQDCEGYVVITNSEEEAFIRCGEMYTTENFDASKL